MRPTAAAASEERPASGLTGRVIVASALLLLVIGAAFAVLLRAVDDLRDSTRAAQSSQEVLATANEVERLVVDMETGVRGIVITGREQFLQPWEAARRTLHARPML